MISELSFRKSNLQDVKLYYQWVNDKEVRKNAFNQSSVSWIDHKSWFENKLRSDNTHLFVLEHNSNPVGQIRFDMNDEGTWEIDYSIDVQYRGSGYGKMILQKGVDSLNTLLDNPKILAKVKSDNQPSKKVFLSIGFIEKREGDILIFYYQ